MSDINQWREIAIKNPIIFLEQAWIDLQDDSSREARDVYMEVATLDPTNSARLVQHYAVKPWAAEVLVQAYRAFPTALETYPQWKELPFANEVQEGMAAVEAEHSKKAQSRFRAGLAAASVLRR